MSAVEPTEPGHLRVTLLALTFTTGLVDAVSYLGLGRVFTANMTGNVVLLGFGLGGSHVVWIAGALVSLAFFLTGAVIGGRLTTQVGDRFRYLLGGLGLETLLVALAAIVSLPAQGTGARLVLVGLLATAMGVRNAVVRRLAVPDMTTTVLTLTLTGLASDSTVAGGSGGQMLRRGGAAAAMLVGAVAGALLVRQDITLALTAAAAMVAATMAGLWSAVRADAPAAPADPAAR